MAGPFTAFLVASTALQTIGNIKANFDQAREEEYNAEELRAQARYARFVREQEIGLVDRKYSQAYGAQATAYAAGGVDVGAGSAAMTLADTVFAGAQEAYRVKRRFDEEIRMLNARAARSDRISANLRDPMTNLLQVSSAFVGAGSQMYSGQTNYIGAGEQGATRPVGGY